MNKKDLIKAGIILGGGLLIFAVVKYMKKSSTKASVSGEKKSFADDKQPTTENAEIVANAYMSALKSKETPARLTELNKECIKEFGMRCYIADDGSVVVCDTKGETILTKDGSTS
jgi:hypothetical protein